MDQEKKIRLSEMSGWELNDVYLLKCLNISPFKTLNQLLVLTRIMLL